MIAMVSNQSGTEIGYLASEYRGLLGHLFSPGGQRGPWPFLPYALDNGAYAAWQANIEFPEAPWRKLLDWAARQAQAPLWAAVPDQVANREKTLAMWPVFAPVVREYGWRPAFVLQDEMTFDDVPDSECMLFIGGTTPWKVSAIGPWCARFPGRVHVGRVTTAGRIMQAYDAGAVSIDGTGWFHDENQRGGRPKKLEPAGQKAELLAYLRHASNVRRAA